MYSEHQCFDSDWPTKPGARDFRFPVFTRAAALYDSGTAVFSDDALKNLRARAYEQIGTFSDFQLQGHHLTWRADALLVLLKPPTNVPHAGPPADADKRHSGRCRDLHS